MSLTFTSTLLYYILYCTVLYCTYVIGVRPSNQSSSKRHPARSEIEVDIYVRRINKSVPSSRTEIKSLAFVNLLPVIYVVEWASTPSSSFFPSRFSAVQCTNKCTMYCSQRDQVSSVDGTRRVQTFIRINSGRFSHLLTFSTEASSPPRYSLAMLLSRYSQRSNVSNIE